MPIVVCENCAHAVVVNQGDTVCSVCSTPLNEKAKSVYSTQFPGELPTVG